MQIDVETSVTFAIQNRMYGVNLLAKHLNELVRSGHIKAWHPGRWIDWSHRQIEISFDSVGDARRADAAQADW